MSNSQTSTSQRETKLRALCALSGASPVLDPTDTTRLIKQAPDPETALQAVFAKIPSCSKTLQRQWRKTVIDMWASQHPHIPLLLDLPLTTDAVNETLALRDAYTVLEEVKRQPLDMVQEKDEWLLSSEAIYRLGSKLPSLHGQYVFPLEHEWGYPIMRRVRAVLQLLRLVRRVKDKLYVVNSRHERFVALPAIQQFYLLWHVDTYHLDWAVYAGMWSPYIRVVQEYLPLLWELADGVTIEMPQDITHWGMHLWEAYYPLWEQEGLLSARNNKNTVLSLIQRHYLPAALTTVLLRDLLGRYGLVLMEGEFFMWTELGTTLLSAERNQEIPCGLELLA